MNVWRRHAASGDKMFHAGREAGGSFVTLCNGRWSLTDEVDDGVQYDANPPHAHRCEACQRQRIDVLRIEQGLSELAESRDTELNEDLYDVERLFDYGGEA